MASMQLVHPFLIDDVEQSRLPVDILEAQEVRVWPRVPRCHPVVGVVRWQCPCKKGSFFIVSNKCGLYFGLICWICWMHVWLIFSSLFLPDLGSIYGFKRAPDQLFQRDAGDGVDRSAGSEQSAPSSIHWLGVTVTGGRYVVYKSYGDKWPCKIIDFTVESITSFTRSIPIFSILLQFYRWQNR